MSKWMLLFLVLVGPLGAAPAPPSPVALVPAGVSGSLNFSWAAVTAPAGVTGYQIYRATYSDLSAAFPVSYVAALSYTDTGLVDGVTYWLAVAADMGGAQSLTISAVPWAPLDAPAMQSVALPYGTGVHVEWTSPATHGYSVGSYHVMSVLNGIATVIRSVAANLSYTTLSLPCATGVSLQVQAVDIMGNTGVSSAISLVSYACAPAVSVLGMDSGALTLAWTDSPGTISPTAQYTVRYATYPGAVDAAMTVDVMTGGLTITTSSALPGNSRWYRVNDVAVGGLVSASANEFAVLAPPVAVNAYPSQGSVLLTWSRPSLTMATGLTNYQVFYATYNPPLTATAGTSLLVVPDPGPGALVQVTVTSLADEVPIYFSVASAGGLLNSQFGALGVTVSVTPYLPTPMIRNISQTQGGAISLVWNLPDITPNTAASFNVYVATDSFLSSQSLLINITATTTTVQQPTNPNSYWFVMVTDTLGHTSSFTPTAAALFAPTLLTPVVSVSLTTNARVYLSWTADTNATEYQVYRATQGVTGTAAVFVTTPAWIVRGSYFTDTSPVNGQVNLYQVLARRTFALPGSKLESPLSLAVSAMPIVAPGIPGVFTAGGLSAGVYLTATVRSNLGFVDLSWAPADLGSHLISRYTVYQGRDFGNLSYLTDVFGGVTSYAHAVGDPTGLVYGVEAVDISGTVGLRLTGTATAFMAWAAPQTPTAWVLNSGVQLNWSPPAGVGTYPFTAYQVFRRDQSSSTDVAVTIVAGTSFTDTPPLASRGTQLSYAIGVVDSMGIVGNLTRVAASFGSVAFTGTLPLPPMFPNAQCLTGSTSSVPVLIQWQPNPENQFVTGYTVYRGTFAFLNTTATSALDVSTTVGATYTYRVVGLNSLGSSLPATVTPSPIDIRPPQPAPISVSLTVDASGSTTLAYRLYWPDLGVPSSIDFYRVYRSTAGFASASLLATTVTSTSFVDNTIASSPAPQINYTVVSVIGGFESSSPVAGLVLNAMPPVAPIALSASAQNGVVRLGWAPQGQARQYWIFRASTFLGSVPPMSSFLVSVTAGTYTDLSVNAGNIWNYAVAATNELGRGPATYLAVTPEPDVASQVSATAGFSGGLAQVSLAWVEPLAPVNATSYEIWRGTSPATLAKIATLASPATSFVDSTVLTNVAYTFQVRSFNRDFSQGPATVGPVKAFGAIASPTGLRVVGGLGRIDVAWDQPSSAQGVTGYALSFNASNGSNTFSLSLPAQPNAVAVSGLASATEFSVTLTAQGSSGSSNPVAKVTQTNAVGPAIVPISFTAKVGFYDFVKVNLTWNPVGVGNSALIYRSTQPIPVSVATGGASSPIYLTGFGGSVGAATDLAVSAKQPYYYALSAVSPDGMPGGESLAISTGPVLPFLFPSGLSLTVTAGVGRVDLQWSPPSFSGTAGLGLIPAYRVYRYQTSSSVSVFGQSLPDLGFPLGTTATAYTDTQVTVGAAYQYFVTVIDQAGREQDAGEGRLNIVPTGLPGTPAPPLVVAGDSSVTLRWVAKLSDTLQGLKFNVYRRQPSIGSDYSSPIANLFQVGPSSNTDYQGTVQMLVLTVRDMGDNPVVGTPGSLINTTRYCYALSQVNIGGESGKSSEVCTIPYKPIKPNVLTMNLTVIGKKDVSLTWDGTLASGADAGSYGFSAFRIYRSADGGTTYTLLTQLTTTAYVDGKTVFGSSYVYRVVPVDTGGNEGYSYNLVSIVIPAARNAVLLFRNSFNPAKGETVSVQYGLIQSGHAWVRIYTLEGEFVSSLFEEDVPLASVSNPYLSQKKDWDGRNAAGQMVASGVYIVHLEATGYRENARVAVIK